MTPRRRVVVVDNDDAVIELVASDLRLEGHEIVGTSTAGEAAVQLCWQTHPDVAVVDLRLGPGIDGLEVARQVSEPGLRVVVHTNYVTPAVVEAARAVGAAVVEKGSLRALRRAVQGPPGARPPEPAGR